MRFVLIFQLELNSFHKDALMFFVAFFCLSVTKVAKPTSWGRCKLKDAVNNSFTGQSVKMKTTGICKLKTRKQQYLGHHTDHELLVKKTGSNLVWNCAVDTMCHFVANCTLPVARQQP